MFVVSGRWERKQMGSLKQLVADRRTALGAFCGLGVDAMELACHAGFDFVLIDGQHGSFDLEGLKQTVRAAQATPSVPVARLPAHGLMLIEALLDAGYTALIAPMVNSAEEARALVSAAYYPPMGQRSQSSCRASLREGATYRDRFNGEMALLVMIEHVRGVEQIDAILSVPGVTGCFIGPTDLASSLSAEGRTEKKALADAIERVRAAAVRAGKWVGITAGSAEEARELGKRGFQLVVVSTDRKLLHESLKQIASAWQEGNRDGAAV